MHRVFSEREFLGNLVLTLLGDLTWERQGEGSVGMCGLCLLDSKAVSFMFQLDSFSPHISMSEPETGSQRGILVTWNIEKHITQFSET